MFKNRIDKNSLMDLSRWHWTLAVPVFALIQDRYSWIVLLVRVSLRSYIP
jgi:hypothetical protein